MAPAIERAFTESDAVLIEEFIKGGSSAAASG